MASGMWTAVSSAAARAQAVDVIANNMANADTPAFKKDMPVFREYLASVEREPAHVDIPQGPIKDKDLRPLDGRDQSFVIVDGTYTNLRQGNLKVTHSPLDVAMDGPGFLEVSTPAGIRYTRQGSLKLATDGRLVTAEGYPVLAAQPGGLAAAQPASAVQPGQGGPSTQGGVAAGAGADANIAARFIQLSPELGALSITASGEVFAGPERIGRLAVTEFQDGTKLRKTGGSLFENRDPTNVIPDAANTVVRQGMIETSNVNPIEEMTAMIRANRLFEQDMKSLKTFSDLMGREANDLGKL